MTRAPGEVAAEPCVALDGAAGPLERFEGREMALGALSITRILPVKGRRLVGPWCFLDRFGPLAFGGARPMDVAPHPHIGLQTVTWLLDGEVQHDDSLGFECVGRPGGVSVMTAGDGIAHAEQTPAQNSGVLNGVQLWVALPDGARRGPAGFEHVPQVPVAELPGGLVKTFAGTLAGVRSPATHHSPILGAELTVRRGEALCVDLDRRFEHGFLLLDGDITADDTPLTPHVLFYAGRGRTELACRSREGGRVLCVGGAPFGETVLMWWNFVARTPEEIRQAAGDWAAGVRFGTVRGHDGPPIPAPPLVKLATPNPMS